MLRGGKEFLPLISLVSSHCKCYSLFSCDILLFSIIFIVQHSYQGISITALNGFRLVRGPIALQPLQGKEGLGTWQKKNNFGCVHQLELQRRRKSNDAKEVR